MSQYTDLALEPLELSNEFETEEQEPHLQTDYDFLHLKNDLQLDRFFQTIEGHHSPSLREKLLLSTSGYVRRVDAALFHESRRPVVQGAKNTRNRPPSHQHQHQQQLQQATMIQQSPPSEASFSLSLGPISSPSPAAVLGAPLSEPQKLSFWQRLKQPSPSKSPPTPMYSASASPPVPMHHTPAVAAAPLSTTSSVSSATNSKISDWFRRKPTKPKQEEIPFGTPAPSPLSAQLHPNVPPTVLSPSYSTSRRSSFSSVPLPHPISELTSTRSTTSSIGSASSSRSNRSRPGSFSNNGGSIASYQTASDEQRLARAPVSIPPEACTFVLSNLALYIFPPAVPISIEDLDPDPSSPSASSSSQAQRRPQTKYFLVYNEYRRIALQDLQLLCLPYRSGLTRHGSDFALRITDFTLHLRSASIPTLASSPSASSFTATDNFVWLQAEKNQRSIVAETISDAYNNLVGLPLEMHQLDYSELISQILSGAMSTFVKDLQIQWWARKEHYVYSGYLLHRSVQLFPGDEDPITGALPPPPPPPVGAPLASPSNWRKKWFVLTSDNYLLHFNSPQELEAFQYVVKECTFNTITNKFPAHFDCNQIDLSKSLHLRTYEGNDPSATPPGSFEIVVYPRSSTSSLYAGGGIDAEYNDDLHRQTLMQYGYMRHLFQIPPPPSATSSPANSATSVMMVASKSTTSSPVSSMAIAAATSAMPIPSKSPSKPPTSNATSVYMEAEVNKWLKALRHALKGAGLPATPLIQSARSSPSSSPPKSELHAPLDAASAGNHKQIGSSEPSQTVSPPAIAKEFLRGPIFGGPTIVVKVDYEGASAPTSSPLSPDMKSATFQSPTMDITSPIASPNDEPVPELP